MLQIKRAYEASEASEASDGKRILVDRLWPRGISREKAHIDEWMKDLSPSQELRQWFSHEPEKWQEFKRKYNAELSKPEQRALLKKIAQLAKTENVTLVYAARNTEYNNARALQEIIATLSLMRQA